MVAEIPLCSWMRRPQLPDTKELSVTVAIQPDGSGVPVNQALAERVVPTTLKSILYDVPAVAAKGTVFNVVYAPFTFFCITRLLPLTYALYQLFLSVQRKTAPKLALVKLLIEPLKISSAFVATGPSTALYTDPPFES